MEGARHGTLTGYTKDGCGCDKCLPVGTKARKMHHLGMSLKADATPLRKHIKELRRTMSLQDLIDHSGVSRITILKIQQGKQAAALRSTAEKILAVTPMIGKGVRINATGSQRRVQALTAMGWTNDEMRARIGQQQGNTATNLTHIMRKPQITVALADAIRAAYEEMRAQKPPMEYGNRRAKARAQRRKWAPPAAWEENIDDPAAKPDWEAVLCEFVECGRPVKPGRPHCGPCETRLTDHGTLDSYAPLKNGAALVENAQFVSHAEGWPLNQEAGQMLIAKRLGVSLTTLSKALNRQAKQEHERQAEVLATVAGAGK